MEVKADVCVVGGGILGLSCAYLALKESKKEVVILEKEEEVGLHQSSRNSGVVHSGIYYPPDSYKARFCLKGKKLLKEFCTKENIPLVKRGKLIVASSEDDFPAFYKLKEYAEKNGIVVFELNSKEAKEVEPYVKCIKALHLPEVEVVNFSDVVLKLAERVAEFGGEILKGRKAEKVSKSSQEIVIECSGGVTVRAKKVISCAGLQSDRVAALFGWKSSVRIIPFKGIYYKLKEEWKHLCRGLIYPTPKLSLPFLGIHLTRTALEEVK
ncbi:MAG: FAD-dependent oxidoreductase, partial [Candidatus Dadabacteria bacterium]